MLLLNNRCVNLCVCLVIVVVFLLCCSVNVVSVVLRLLLLVELYLLRYWVRCYVFLSVW